ncbi:TonB-dependent receptor plug domain-containing protein [Candidatus Sororendozoicomonas aggregata]|uniref:TonB-dependent receptor plug domain-containing protein n=1 Tax=Candidatus Sororendozoicomonas aggregata TaxID=3073239 RepID=UPI002ED5E073
MKIRILPTRKALPAMSTVVFGAFLWGTVHADDNLGSTVDLLDFSLQELMVLQVTSVSRRVQRQFDAAAAIYTITQDDIRNLGITSIPEALRTVPGMQVAKLNGSTWSLSARGFNYVFANKLLVLIDGRTVYTPLFSGVNWDAQNVMMDDIDRIEVIRGPGAALWGSNAVNGVINIITKHTEDTQGGLLRGSVGTEEKTAGAVRYGGELSDDTFYRIYAQGFERDGQKNKDGSDARDGWFMHQAGFRFDRYFSDRDDFTLQSDIYEGSTRPPYYVYDPDQHQLKTVNNLDRAQRGGNVLAKFTRSLDNGEVMLKSYGEYYQNDDLRLNEKRDTWDIEFQHSFSWWDDHTLVWGGNYRIDWYNLDPRKNHYVTLKENKFSQKLWSLFVQDSFRYTPTLEFTLSTRVQHNETTGSELQPNARFSWTPNKETTVWGALSRAVKTPALSETSLEITNISYTGILQGNDTMFAVSGNPDLVSEKLTAFDLGFRRQVTPDFSVDIAGYLNFYKDVTSYQYYGPGQCQSGFQDAVLQDEPVCIDPLNLPPIVGGTGPVVFPTILGNTLEVFTHGVEIAADWQIKDWWRLRLNYSYINVDADTQRKDDYGRRNEAIVEGIAAKHTANLFSFMQLPDDWTLNLWFKYMSKLHLDPHYEVNNIKDNANLDIRIAKELKPGLEASLVGQNLLHHRQLQFYEVFTGQTQTNVERSAYLQLRWTF